MSSLDSKAFSACQHQLTTTASQLLGKIVCGLQGNVVAQWVAGSKPSVTSSPSPTRW